MIYNFSQSIEDRATVPLYYENRSPEVQLINDRFNQDMEQHPGGGRAGRGSGAATSPGVRP